MIHIFIILIFAMMPVAMAKEPQKMPPMHHLYDIKPSEHITIPETFPLNKKKQISCQTCHGIKDIKDRDFKKINKQDKAFLRQGPYDDVSQFCFKCHDKKPYKRSNIHKMLDKKGKIIKSHCLYCHKEKLDTDKEYKAGEQKLRLPVSRICYGCHLDTPHINALAHQKKPEKEMLERIRQYEQQHKIKFPLAKNGKITCITCHSPHPPGVISQDRAAGKVVNNKDMDAGVQYAIHPWNRVFVADKKGRIKKLEKETGESCTLNYQRIEKEILLRLPAVNGSLCLVCHEFKD